MGSITNQVESEVSTQTNEWRSYKCQFRPTWLFIENKLQLKCSILCYRHQFNDRFVVAFRLFFPVHPPEKQNKKNHQIHEIYCGRQIAGFELSLSKSSL